MNTNDVPFNKTRTSTKGWEIHTINNQEKKDNKYMGKRKDLLEELKSMFTDRGIITVGFGKDSPTVLNKRVVNITYNGQSFKYKYVNYDGGVSENDVMTLHWKSLQTLLDAVKNQVFKRSE